MTSQAAVPLIYDIFHVAGHQTLPSQTARILELLIPIATEISGFKESFGLELKTRTQKAVYELDKLLCAIPPEIEFVVKDERRLTSEGGETIVMPTSLELSTTKTATRQRRGISIGAIKRNAMTQLAQRVQSGELSLENYIMVDGIDNFSFFATGYKEGGFEDVPSIGNLFKLTSVLETVNITEATNTLLRRPQPDKMSRYVYISALSYSFTNQRRALRRETGMLIEPNELVGSLISRANNILSSYVNWERARFINNPNWTPAIKTWLSRIEKDIAINPRSDNQIWTKVVTEVRTSDEIIKAYADNIRNSTSSLWEAGDGFKASNYSRLKEIGVEEVVFYTNWEPLSNEESYKARLTLQSGEEINILFTLDGMFYFHNGKEYIRVFIPHIAGTRILKTFAELISQILRTDTASDAGETDATGEYTEPQESTPTPSSTPNIPVRPHISRLPNGKKPNIKRMKKDEVFGYFLSEYTKRLSNGTVDLNSRYTYTRAHMRRPVGTDETHSIDQVRYH